MQCHRGTDNPDRYHTRFWVYGDLNEGGNHFYPSGWMGDTAAITMDSCSNKNPFSGETCIEVTFKASTNNWAGVYWQFPEGNWGATCGAGYDLTGATRVSFWARGTTGQEMIEFFTGGLGWPNAPCPDSFAKRSIFVTLSTSWKQYSIDLVGADLSYVISGFGWVANAPNNPSGIRFYLDDIVYDVAKPGDLRLLTSYSSLGGEVHAVLKNAAFTYDNAVALLAFLGRGTVDDLERARILADCFVYALGHDRFYSDGRLRNAYQSGDLVDVLTGDARMPGWWDCDVETWLEDEFQVSSYTGNLAWAALALIHYYERAGGHAYLQAAISIAGWIHANALDARGPGGYTAGFLGWEPSPTKLLWKSTEHQIDYYVLGMKLWELTGDDKWRRRAMWAKRFVRAMWDPVAGHFWTGTLEDGVTINTSAVPTDVQAWALLALGEAQVYGRGMLWAGTNSKVQEPCCNGQALVGLDFNEDQDGIWWEGTAQSVLAFEVAGGKITAARYRDMLRRVQQCGPGTDGKGIVATCHDGVTTGFDWEYDTLLHVAPTAWYALAELAENPFWMIGTGDTIPYQGEYE